MKPNLASIYIFYSIYCCSKIVAISSKLPIVNALKQDSKYNNSIKTEKGSDRWPPIERIFLKRLINVSSDTTVEPSGQSDPKQQNLRTKRDALGKST